MSPLRSNAGSGGFTILELSVVMGLLAVFMMFLLQIVFTTTEIFQEGQAGQDQAAKSLAAVRPVEAALRNMVGPTQESKREASDARLLVGWIPLGLGTKGKLGMTQVLRSTVRLSRGEERGLLEDQFRPKVAEEIGADNPEKLAAVLRQLIRGTGLKARGEMLLLAWPSGDPEGAFLELRRGIFLAGSPLPFKEANGATLLMLPDLGDPEFPAKRVEAHTKVLATNLLHLSFRLATQYTENWTEGPDDKGPVHVWDSARVGWLLKGERPEDRFPLDLGSLSAQDSTDDVYPRYIEVTVVAGRGASELPEAHLDRDISSEDRTIQLINTDRLPMRIHDNFLKIGSEWVQFGDLRGRTLTGVRRGMRGTTAKAHDRRTGVRAGKTEVLMIKILHGKDSWNG